MSKAEALPLGAASPVKVSSRTLPNKSFQPAVQAPGLGGTSKQHRMILRR